MRCFFLLVTGSFIYLSTERGRLKAINKIGLSRFFIFHQQNVLVDAATGCYYNALSTHISIQPFL